MKKVCIVTSTRADYGIMSGLVHEFVESDSFIFRLCVTGTHLSEKYGYTRQYIDIDDECIDEVDILSNGDKVIDVYSSTIKAFDNYFKNNPFDLVIILGDRYEMFVIASIAYINRIKIAHIHGGETTYGALDEQFRHCITKLANLHFTSCERYRNRVIQLGEDPVSVFNVGSLSVENINKLEFKTIEELRESLGFKLDKYALITFNPVTTAIDNGINELENLIKSLTSFDYELIFLYPNIDAGKDAIISLLKDLECENAHIIKSLPYIDYLSLAKHADLFIGNSSAGIIEMPSLNIPIIDVGNRQDGRERSINVIHCNAVEREISDAINYVQSEEYKKLLAETKNIYDKPHTAQNIIKEVKKYLSSDNQCKYFYDIL